MCKKAVRRAYIYLFEVLAGLALLDSIMEGGPDLSMGEGAIMVIVLTALACLWGYVTFLLLRSDAATPNLSGTLAATAYGTGACLLLVIGPMHLIPLQEGIAGIASGLGIYVCYMYIVPCWITRVNSLGSIGIGRQICLQSVVVMFFLLIAVGVAISWLFDPYAP